MTESSDLILKIKYLKRHSDDIMILSQIIKIITPYFLYYVID